MAHRVIRLHTQAPSKPAEGEPCNGCGVCCATAPCPVGMLASLRLRGACRLLRWDDRQTRYVCGAVLSGPPPWRRLMRRWIAAGQGCDAALQVQAAVSR